MEKPLYRLLCETITDTLDITGGVPLSANDTARSIVDSLAVEHPEQWSAMRGQIVLDYITSKVPRAVRRRLFQDQPSGWLPGFEHVPAAAQDDTLEQFRERIRLLAVRIKGYEYARRIKEKLKRDKRQLREMEELDAKLAPYFALVPGMTIGQAAGLYQTSARRQRREASQSAVLARMRRTKNQ